MITSSPDLVVLYEHPEWQKPLFAALERRGVAFATLNISEAAFSNLDPPAAPLYFNQASPSAYIRGHARAVPLALAYMRSRERLDAPAIAYRQARAELLGRVLGCKRSDSPD